MTKILVDKLVLEQALEACEQRLPLQGQAAIIDELNALRAALAEPVQEPDPGEYHGWVLREVLFQKGEPVGHREPVQEPVAQVHPNHLKPTDDGKPWCREVLLYSGDHNGDLSKGENYRVKLYTAPPQRPVEPIEPTPTFHVEPLKWGCGVCRIGADGKAYGYVCPRLDCPTKVTCGGAV